MTTTHEVTTVPGYGGLLSNCVCGWEQWLPAGAGEDAERRARAHERKCET